MFSFCVLESKHQHSATGGQLYCNRWLNQPVFWYSGQWRREKHRFREEHVSLKHYTNDCNFFNFSIPSRLLRSMDQQLLAVPKTPLKTTGNHPISIISPKLWNDPPALLSFFPFIDKGYAFALVSCLYAERTVTNCDWYLVQSPEIIIKHLTELSKLAKASNTVVLFFNVCLSDTC